MDLVEDHESVFVLCQVKFRFRQFGSVRWQFKVEVEGLLRKRVRQSCRERRLAHLPGSENRHGWKLFEQVRQLRLNLTGNEHLAIMPHEFINARIAEIPQP